jgi:hypothetical protein
VRAAAPAAEQDRIRFDQNDRDADRRVAIVDLATGETAVVGAAGFWL